MLQFCGNDFSNNLYALDREGYPFNNHHVRPYLEDDTVVYKLPLPFAKLREHSFIADRILGIYDRYVWDRATKDLKAYFEERDRRNHNKSTSEAKTAKELQRQSIAVTNKIYAMIRKRAGSSTRVFLLNIDDDPVVEELCRIDNITCIPGAAKELISKEATGVCVKIPNNGHWNKLGNQLVGKTLVEYFKKENVLSQ